MGEAMSPPLIKKVRTFECPGKFTIIDSPPGTGGKLPGTLPEEDAHCAELAAGALYLDLVNYRELKYFPWNKLYQKK